MFMNQSKMAINWLEGITNHSIDRYPVPSIHKCTWLTLHKLDSAKCPKEGLINMAGLLAEAGFKLIKLLFSWFQLEVLVGRY